MTHPLKALLAGFMAAGVLMSLVAGASAAEISASEGEITSRVAQSLTFGEGSATAACNFTMTGTLNTSATVGENELIQIGGMTSGTGSSECTGLGNSVTLLSPETWLIYMSYDLLEDGDIDLLLLIRPALFLLNLDIAGSCLYEGSWISRQTLTSNPATLRHLEFELGENSNIPLSSGGFFCPNPHRWQGTAPLSPALEIGVTLP